MKALTTAGNLDAFFERAARTTAPGHRILFLDYDGTIAPFHVARDEAVPYPGVRERLTTISADPLTRLVIVSGRPVAGLKPLLGLDPAPELWGNHGDERLLHDGRYLAPTLTAAARAGLDRARAWAKAQRLGERCEDKPASIAIHSRGLADAPGRALMDKTVAAWSPFAADAGLAIHAFDGGVELRPVGQSKAVAVLAVLDSAPANAPGDAVIAYLGDDATDEEAFVALGSRALKVLVRPELRATAADIWLVPPDDMLAFLDRWVWLTRR